MNTPDGIGNEEQQCIAACDASQPNLPIAIIVGSGAALISAIVWAAITVATEYQIGWMAIGVGLLVGFAVRLGKGSGTVFSIIGATLALLGCILGNFFSFVAIMARELQMTPFAVLGMVDYLKVPMAMIQASSAMDVLFYGLAVYGGYKYSVVPVSPEAIAPTQESIDSVT